MRFSQDGTHVTNYITQDDQSPYGDSSNSFVLFGDSITSNCHMSVVTPTAVSRSGTTVTVTAGTHLMQVGKKVKVANLMPDDFNGIVTCSAVDATHWYYEKSGTQGSAVIAGTTHPSTGTMEIKDLTNLGGNGMWVWVNGLMGGSLQLVANVARGGWSAKYMLENINSLEAEILETGKKARNAYIAAGINDIVGLGLTVAEVIESLTGLVNQNKAMGRRVFLDTLKPLGASHASYSTTTKAKIAEVNRWILKTAPALLGVIPIDTYSTLINPATGAAKTGLLGSESIHPNVNCQIDYIAPLIKAVFVKYLEPSSILPVSIGDTYGANAISTNLSDVGPWATTSGGSTSGTITGSVCAGFTLTETGAASASAAQINTNAAGFVEQQFDLSATVAAGDTIDLTYPFTVARLPEGTKVRLCMKVDLSNLDSANGNIKSFGAYVVCAANGSNGYFQIIEYAGTNQPWTGILTGTKSYTLISEEWVIPPSLTAFNLHVKITGAGALAGSAGTVKVSQIGLLLQ